MNIEEVSDNVLVEEYLRRFTLEAGESITSSQKAMEHFRGSLFNKIQIERFAIIYLNAQNQVITSEVLFEGSLTSSAVYPRSVIARVLEENAAGIIVGHNHPSGSIQPSTQDRMVTKKIQTALEAIDVQILDHIILGGSAFYSFADAGLL